MSSFARFLLAFGCVAAVASAADSAGERSPDARPFGAEFPDLDGWCTGAWWDQPPDKGPKAFSLNVPRKDVIAFALYTVTPGAAGRGTLKLTAQHFPLRPDEPREARLEIEEAGAWREHGTAPVLYPGWDAHFRVAAWDTSRDRRYRRIARSMALPQRSSGR